MAMPDGCVNGAMNLQDGRASMLRDRRVLMSKDRRVLMSKDRRVLMSKYGRALRLKEGRKSSYCLSGLLRRSWRPFNLSELAKATRMTNA